MSSISFSQAKDAELAWLDGQIHYQTTTTGSEGAGQGDKRLVPVLGPASLVGPVLVCVCGVMCVTGERPFQCIC